jgi:hypothetical protein
MSDEPIRFIDTDGQSEYVTAVKPLPVSGTINTLTGLDIPKHDNIALTYTGENLTAVAYKVGASTVATLTLAYTGSRLDSVTKS